MIMRISKHGYGSIFSALVLAGMMCGAGFDARATNYTWTNTVSGGAALWSSGANWTPTGVPGSGAAADSAYLTNAAPGAYTSVLQTSPTAVLSGITLFNGAGSASLLVTQGLGGATSLVVSNLTLANGGRLVVDAGGSISNPASFAWTGTNGSLYLNNGGLLQTPATFYLANGASGRTGLVAKAASASSAGTWDFVGTNYSFIVGYNNAFSNTMYVSGVNITNVYRMIVGSAYAGSTTNTDNTRVSSSPA